MAKNYFPAQGQSYTYLQTNRSDSLGSVWSSMDVDLQTDLNTWRVTPRLLRAYSQALNNVNMGLPVAFWFFDSLIWMAAGSRIFKTAIPNSGWAEDASTGTPTTFTVNSDLAFFNDLLFATTDTAIYSKPADGAGTGTWTSRASIATSTPHPLCYFPVFNRLYFQNGSGTIESMDTTYTVGSDAYILVLGAGNQIGCMVSNSSFVWVSVSGQTSAHDAVARVYAWDGISAVASKVYTIPSRYVMAMTVYKDVVYLMDGNAILYQFTGYAFEEIGRLPFPTLEPRVTTLPSIMQRNGLIATKNGTFLANIISANAGATISYPENAPSGIWEWSKDFGFTHKYGVSYAPSTGAVTITDYSQYISVAPGALFNVAETSPSASNENGSLVMGLEYYTNAADTDFAIFTDDLHDTIIKKGYFVTTWFFSAEVQDNWTRLWAVFRKLLSADDKIVFKYRITETDPLYADILWTGTNTFTTLTDPSAYWTSGTGGEVEVVRGYSGGTCAHITSIVNNAGTFTVTIDESRAPAVVNGNSATVRFQHWVKLFDPVVGTSTANPWAQFNIDAANPRIQIKGCFTFTGPDEFYKFALYSNEDIKVNA